MNNSEGEGKGPYYTGAQAHAKLNVLPFPVEMPLPVEELFPERKLDFLNHC